MFTKTHTHYQQDKEARVSLGDGYDFSGREKEVGNHGEFVILGNYTSLTDSFFLSSLYLPRCSTFFITTTMKCIWVYSIWKKTRWPWERSFDDVLSAIVVVELVGVSSVASLLLVPIRGAAMDSCRNFKE